MVRLYLILAYFQFPYITINETSQLICCISFIPGTRITLRYPRSVWVEASLLPIIAVPILPGQDLLLFLWSSQSQVISISIIHTHTHTHTHWFCPAVTVKFHPNQTRTPLQRDEKLLYAMKYSISIPLWQIGGWCEYSYHLVGKTNFLSVVFKKATKFVLAWVNTLTTTFWPLRLSDHHRNQRNMREVISSWTAQMLIFAILCCPCGLDQHWLQRGTLGLLYPKIFLAHVCNNPVSSHALLIIWMIFASFYLDAVSESCLAAEQTSPRRLWNTFGSSLPICAPSDMPPKNHTTRQLLRNQHVFPSDMTGTVSLILQLF